MLTGPRSFKATIVPRRCTFKSHVSCACEQPDTLTFDAADAVSKAEQRALFAEYTKTAKEQGHKLPATQSNPQRIQYARGGVWFDAPRFTAAAFTAAERQFLGKTVGFRHSRVHHFAPVAGGAANWAANMLHGVVWSRSPYGPAFWVYVEGQGFYSVREDALLTEVKA